MIETPLHQAIELNRLAIVFLLLQCEHVDTRRPNSVRLVPYLRTSPQCTRTVAQHGHT